MTMVYLLFFWLISLPVNELQVKFSPNSMNSTGEMRFEYSEPHMGTLFHLQLYASSQETADAAAKVAFARVKTLNGIFSDYQSDSELMKLCQKAGQGPIKVSAELFDILQRSRDWSERSQGAFDVSVGPLVQLWRRARRTRQLPKEASLRDAQALVDFRLIELLPDCMVQLKKAKMRLDLGGIAKGYAADEMLKVIKSKGITSACIAAGGDVCVSNRPPGKPGWVISVAPLEKTDTIATQLVLENQAVSTSGDLEQYVEIQGVRYSHIVDTKTGLGLTKRMSCTVVARNATDSDAAATAICVMGYEKGMTMINKQPEMACFLAVQEKDTVKRYSSNDWGKYVKVQQPSIK